jgi:hypothetical protein
MNNKYDSGEYPGKSNHQRFAEIWLNESDKRGQESRAIIKKLDKYHKENPLGHAGESIATTPFNLISEMM